MTKTAINTRTQEEYDALMRYYESKGMRWGGGQLPTKFDNWSRFKKDTWILPNYFEDGVLEYGSTEEVKRTEGISVRIPYTEFAKANIEPDYKALYLEGRELLEAIMRIKDLWVPEYPVSEKHMGEAEALYNMGARISEYLTKHKDLTPSGE